MKAGEVRVTAWDGRKVRVLCADDVEVLYDAWWPHAQRWGIQRLDARAHYYRVPTSVMAESSELVGDEPLSDAEHAVHRPDLPLRLLRKLGWRFGPEACSDRARFAEAVRARGVGLPEGRVLDAPSVVLVPRGPRGALLRGERIDADDEEAFGALELLFEAHRVQSKHARESSDGAGIYRLGCAAGLPSFYLAGDRDLAGFLED